MSGDLEPIGPLAVEELRKARLASIASSLLQAAGWEERRGWIPPELVREDYTDGMALWNAVATLASRMVTT